MGRGAHRTFWVGIAIGAVLLALFTAPAASTEPGPLAIPGGAQTPSPSGTASSSPSPRPSSDPCRERWRIIDDDDQRSGRSLYGVAVRNSNTAWAVGSSTTKSGSSLTLVERWNGRNWAREDSPSARGETSVLSGVDAAGTGPVWAVGNHSRTTLGTIALRRSGGRWRDMNSPDPGAGLSSLNAVSVASRRSVWAVGTRWDSAGRHRVLIERWNGRRWSVAPPSMEGILDGVYARRNNDVWAVGRVIRRGKSRTLTLHFNGSRWRQVRSPNETDKPHYLLAVDGRARNDVWAVGYRDGRNSNEQPISMRWNGKRWRSLDPPDIDNGHGQLTGISVWRDDVVAVGDFGTRRDFFQTLVLTWANGKWRREDMSEHTDGDYLEDADHTSSGELFTAGYRSTGGGSEVILHRSEPCP